MVENDRDDKDSTAENLFQRISGRIPLTEINKKTDERILPEGFRSKEDYLLYLRHLFAYEFAKRKALENNLVLEIGSGEGYGTSLISQNVSKIIGLDVDPATVSNASSKYGSERCMFRTYDGVSVPYAPDTFDIVISFQVIEHIENVPLYISEVYRVLRDNGIFILTTPNRIYRLKPGQEPWNKYHIREFYPHEVRNVLETKFRNVKIFGIRGNEEVQRIEIERVKQKGKPLNKWTMVRLLDPLGITRLIPAPLKAFLRDNLKRKKLDKNRRGKNQENFIERYSLDVYSTTEENVEEGLDILGVCKK